MQTVATKAQRISDKIKAVTSDRSIVVSKFSVTSDDSTQAELRLRASWVIDFPVDEIKWPNQLSGSFDPLWTEIIALNSKITSVSRLVSGSKDAVLPISARTKTGPEKRAEAKAAFVIEAGQAFLADYKEATSKKALDRVRSVIADLQNRQKALIPRLRKANSEYLAQRKAAKAERNRKNTEALAAGRFWECDREYLKGYFHPPFARNYLADVSEKWRAALYTEMESTAWKARKGDWRHKNIGTGWAYLCGIDDNGDEWGHLVNLRSMMNTDRHGDLEYMASVEDAMCKLFDIPKYKIRSCVRQGDLLFCPEAIPDVELHPHEGPLEVRESHRIESPSLERNGQWFRSADPITVTHTSHQPVTLEPGEYRLYTLQSTDTDPD